VRRVKKIGNAHIFEAVVTRKAAHNRLIDELLHVFGGSPRSLMAQLVETGQLTLGDIRDLESTLAKLAADRIATTEADSQKSKSPRHARRRGGSAR
jgi:predicted transcriptional regulator